MKMRLYPVQLFITLLVVNPVAMAIVGQLNPANLGLMVIGVVGFLPWLIWKVRMR